MPIYEYHCNACKKNFEYLVLSKSEPEACPLCGEERIEKLMSACGFLCKGRGGETVSSSASASSCGTCSAASCAGCGS